ncbi:MAG: hypothetical protein AAF614_32140 [Chloroflexota bacterium]
MKTILEKTLVMQRDGRQANIAYTSIAVLVAIAMLIAASGSGTGVYESGQLTLGRWVLDTGGNVLAVIIAVLVLIPRTRILGAILAVILMFISIYLNYTIDGIEFFARAIPYNTITIMLGSILIGHYFEDLRYLFRPTQSAQNGQLSPSAYA